MCLNQAQPHQVDFAVNLCLYTVGNTDIQALYLTVAYSRVNFNFIIMRFAPILSRPARFNQKEPVPFQEILPLRLKENVSGKGDKTSEVSCLHEMSILFACMKTHEFDQSLCAKEISNFQHCYTTNLTKKRVKKEQELKGILTPGQKAFTHKQVNQMLRRFPNIK